MDDLALIYGVIHDLLSLASQDYSRPSCRYISIASTLRALSEIGHLMSIIAIVFQDYGTVCLIHSLMKHPNHAYLVIQVVLMVALDQVLITVSVSISNVETVVILAQILNVDHVVS
jgi:hypothetical protein